MTFPRIFYVCTDFIVLQGDKTNEGLDLQSWAQTQYWAESRDPRAVKEADADLKIFWGGDGGVLNHKKNSPHE